jgi:hypothetical protein
MSRVPVVAEGDPGDPGDIGRVDERQSDVAERRGPRAGMSLLANALRDPDIMTREGGRLSRWLDTLARTS